MWGNTSAKLRELVHHAAPIRIGRRQTKAKEAEGADGDHDIAETQTGIDDERARSIRQDLDEHDAPRGFTAQLCGRDERAVPQGQRQASRQSHDGRTQTPGSPRERCSVPMRRISRR